jgi:hypothetical protein
METMMSTNDTSYGVVATSERELTIDKLDAVSGAIDTFFHALLRPAALSHSDGLIEPQRGLTGTASRARGCTTSTRGIRCDGRNQRLDGPRWVSSKEALR